MKMNFYKPSPKLSDFVHFYWIFETTDKLDKPATQRIIPNGSIELMFHLSDPISKLTERNEVTSIPKNLLKGQLSNYYDIQYTGKPKFVSVLFKPHGARMFFDVPMSMISDINFNLNDMLGNESVWLAEKLTDQASNLARINIIEDFLFRRLAAGKLYNFKRINAGMRILVSEEIHNRVDPLSSAACLSNKQFDRLFLEYTGMHPKLFLQVVRLQQLMHRLHLGNYSNLTDLALGCGYYDQAHCIKEVKRFTGYTPLQLSQQDIPESDLFMQV
jgi:AraC-like DNA-binding protein